VNNRKKEQKLKTNGNNWVYDKKSQNH